jgi:hypothetical protein
LRPLSARSRRSNGIAGYHPCFAARFGGVSGGKDTHGCRVSSHTEMVGAGKFRSARLPMAGDMPRKTIILPEDRRTARRTKMIGQCVAAFGRPRPCRSLTGKGDLLQAKARLVADHRPSSALALQAVAHSDARWFALNREVNLPAAAGGTTGHWSSPRSSISRIVACTTVFVRPTPNCSARSKLRHAER